MKYLNELYTRIVNGGTASQIVEGLSPMEKGHVGEGLLRLLCLLGIHHSDPTRFVVPYDLDPTPRRIEQLSTLGQRLTILKNGLINSGGSNKVDVCWREGSEVAVCSSKIGKLHIKSLSDLEIPVMLTEFTESGGYKENGAPVPRSSIKPYVLVDNKEEVELVAAKSKDSNKVSRDNLHILDVKDLNRMCAVFRERIQGCPSLDMDTVVGYLLAEEKPSLRTRFHQKLIALKCQRMINEGKKIILIGALPRSGKTYIGASLAKGFQRVLLLTTRPTETLSQWHDVFQMHREFSSYKIHYLNSSTHQTVATQNKQNERMVALASTQFLKVNERDSLLGLHWDLVLLDEIHDGGSTELSMDMLDTYIGKDAIRVMMTATYEKPVYYFTIPNDSCCFWDLEDIRLMRSWGSQATFDRLYQKYGKQDVLKAQQEMYTSGETDASILQVYQKAPQLGILTTVMQQDIYNKLKSMTNTPDNLYGFSMRSLFMTNKEGTAFQNQQAVDLLLALISGSEEMTHFRRRMSMFSRIRRYWQHIGHRNNDQFMTQIWFLPSGTGQLLDHVKACLIQRIQANRVLRNYRVLTLDAGMKGIAKEVEQAVLEAKEAGQQGVILLTGNVGGVGVSLPDADVAFLLHDRESADMNYQQMMRVLTEALNKKYGLVVDFNVWRLLTTLNTYATHRCGQADKSSSERIHWCISNLVDIDPDLWMDSTFPESVPQHKIVDELTHAWRKMLEETGTSLNMLARKPCDLGEDQKDLDSIAHYLKTGHAGTEIEVNEEQEPLSSGIEEYEQGEEQEEQKEKEEEEKQVNLNDILARFIPELAVLSVCKLDLLEAIESILLDPKQHAAMNQSLHELYGNDTILDPFGTLYKIIKRNYSKLIDARESYEVISNRMTCILDNPQELITFLGQHLKPKELEKKQHGEVFTPPELIQQMLDKLPSSVWSDPDMTFLDPANGIGNFPALVFHRLMHGLRDYFPIESERKQHILENMLFMCEINPKNIEVSKKILDPHNTYKLNLFQGSYLDLNPQALWGISHFHVIMGNPPFNSPGKNSSGNTIWQHFVTKSIALLREKAYLVFVHPNGWRKPNTEKGKFNGLFQLMTHDNQLEYLEIHSSKDGKALFKCGTRYDWYVLQKKPCTNKTTIVDEVGTRHSLFLPELSWLPNYKIKEILALLAKQGEATCPIIYDRTAYGADKKDRMSSKQSNVFQYPCIHSTPQKGVRYMYSKFNDRGHFGIPKVIFGESGIHHPVLDVEGAYGITHGAMGITIENQQVGEALIRFLQGNEFQTILKACMFSSFRIDWNLFKEFRAKFWI